ncbi:MAG TPA: hypothetical protein PK082_03500 [Phycisphaerae bacterium]|nr:hypothetical protein [Phycisphaerae bacterium]
MKIRKHLAIVLAAWGLCAAARAQDLPDPADVSPAPDTAAHATPREPDPADRELERMLENMTPEELQQLVKEAMKSRLRVERQQVAREIRDAPMYFDPKAKAAALAVLEKDPADTQKDNIQRICEALAAVDSDFGAVHKLYAKGEYEAAAAKALPALDTRDASYLSAARHFLCAQALARCGQGERAVEVYADLLANMPEKISFAATASVQAAETWEKLGRQFYAMKMYAYCLANYGLTLDTEEARKILLKVEQYQKVYKDPLGTVAGKMGEVQQRLAERDSGKVTQTRQQEIVALLEDLIKLSEERQGQGGNSNSQNNKPREQGESQGQQPPGAVGQQGGNNPSSPMADSMIVPGPTQRPSNLAREHVGDGEGDWSSLPPRQREKLESILKTRAPEGYRDVTRDYHKKLAEDASGR